MTPLSSSPARSSPTREIGEPGTTRTTNYSLLSMAKHCVDTIRSLEERGLFGLSVRVVNRDEKTGKKTKVFIFRDKVLEVFQKAERDRLSGSQKDERLVNLYDWSYKDAKKDSIELRRDPAEYILFKNKNPIKNRDVNNEFPFQREYRILKSYKDTALVASVAGYFMYAEKKNGIETGRLREVIVMRRYQADLRKACRSLIPPPLRETLIQLVEVVAEMHHRGAIHRDLKLDNFLATENGGIVLGDFGAVLEAADTRSLLNLAGSPGNVAPECVKCYLTVEEIIKRWRSQSEEDRLRSDLGKSHILRETQRHWRAAVQPANDVWSLGVVIYELIVRENNHGFPSSLKNALFFNGEKPKMADYLEHRRKFNLDSFAEPADKDSIEHLVWNMLNINPAQRITIDAVLKKLRLIYAKKQDPLPIESRGNSSFDAGANSPVILDRDRESTTPLWRDDRQVGSRTSAASATAQIGSSALGSAFNTPVQPRISTERSSTSSPQEGVNKQTGRFSTSPEGKFSHADSRSELDALMPISVRGSSQASNVYGLVQKPPARNPIYL